MLLFVLIDALRHDYINAVDSPCLYSMAGKGLSGSVVPSFGFEPDAAYLAGLRPDEADGGAMFWLDPERSPFRFVRFLPAALDRLPPQPARFVRRCIRLIVQLTAHEPRVKHWGSPAWIPLPLLPRFSFSSTRLLDDPGFLPAATVFDHLRAVGCAWYIHAMPRQRVAAEKVRDRFVADFTGRESYAFLHIGDLDNAGHRYGPWSNERKAALRHVDDVLSQIIACARAMTGQPDILVLGDHGMAPVERTLDLRPVIWRLNSRGVAFDHFIDATLFRCWSGDADVLAVVRSELERVPGLREIGAAEASRYGLRYRHNRFWDACWQAEEGLVFVPNFHNNRERLLGMHGYLPECLNSRSAFVLSSPRLPDQRCGGSLEAVDMRRFFTTQLALLGLPNVSPVNASLI